MAVINSCSATTNQSSLPLSSSHSFAWPLSTVAAPPQTKVPCHYHPRHPYGIDFPGHIPSGRFSDGKLVPDFLASSLGIKDAVPPFLDPNLSDDELLTGVSFASAGSGFDDLTTSLTNVIPVSKQVEYFKNYIEKLKGIVGEDKAKNITGEALVLISAGTNDLFNFLDLPTRRFEYDSKGYHDFLLQRLDNLVQELYGLGVRKIVIAGLPPLGCLPIQMTFRLEVSPNRKCLNDQNTDSQYYNRRLVKLLPKIQSKLKGSKIVYADIYQPLIDMIKHPQNYGFAETNKGCCGASGSLVASFFL
ncbi:hypothetical protein DITRI_Ditri15bG0023800 [Diplodiscus trichospermus]